MGRKLKLTPAAGEGKKLYAGIIRKKLLAGSLITGLIFSLFLLDMMTGSKRLSVGEVFSTIFSPDSSSREAYLIVWSMRFPVAVMALVTGASLGTAGAELQTILDNPVADPYTLGISSAASLGASVAIFWGPTVLTPSRNLAIPVNAFLFALLSSVLIYAISKFKQGATGAIILAGIAIALFCDSMKKILQHFASYNDVQSIMNWSRGDLTGTGWRSVGVVLLVLLMAVAVLLMDSWKLTSLKLGDNKAKSLGVDVGKLRLKVLVVTSFITAAAVCFAGTIGFVGLMAPHVARHFTGEDQRFFLLFSALIGAGILLFASLAGKLMIPGVIIPIEIITSIIGMPFMLYVILKSKR
jgi:iron complex transport system permease protein